MRKRMIWRGLRVAVATVIMALSGAAWAEDRPPTAPQPRPADIATSETPAAAPSDAGPRAAAPQASAARDGGVGPVTGFPLPRYVSIKAAEANARRGPSRSHRIDWVFQRRNMPVMVVAEHGHWRRVVDRDGAGGWIHYALLSGVRTAIVEADLLPLRARPDPSAMIRAQAERNVIGALRACRNGWCEMEVGGFRGWVEASGLWGVEPGERFD